MDAGRVRTRSPGVATFNIVGPCRPAGVNVGESNNIENGTSAARGPHLRAFPEGARHGGA